MCGYVTKLPAGDWLLKFLDLNPWENGMKCKSTIAQYCVTMQLRTPPHKKLSGGLRVGWGGGGEMQRGDHLLVPTPQCHHECNLLTMGTHHLSHFPEIFCPHIHVKGIFLTISQVTAFT
ncbi:UNVERIFIED_CONTAM: hypothetical protein K2H54_038177 [Gekko kuhli]